MKIEDQSNSVKLQFKIYDTGIGIEKDKISTIFNSFTQANMDTTKTYGGTGLGLAITKQLIDLFGGKIYLESEVGEGTTFHVEISFEKVEESFSVVHKKESGILPRIYKNGKLAIGMEAEEAKDEDEKVGVVAVKQSETFDYTKPSILLAEDNPFNQLLAKTVLNKYFPDAQLTVANNGKQVVEYFNEGKKFDIILMDVQMPEMDGFEATVKIRENKANDSIPIIACTAGVTPPEVQQCFESGMDDFLAKPFQPNDLVNKINFHIQKSKAKQAK
jgi:CheY-like chemotaxis protein